MPFTTIAVTQSAPIAEIRLNRPDDGNPIDPQLLDEIDAAASLLDENDAVRAVLLTTAGGVFSLGWDDARYPRTAVASRASPPFRSLELLGKPVFACIEGDATGAGLELALACDIRVIADTAVLSMPDVAAGHLVSCGGTQRLPRIAGRSVAASVLLLGEALDAQRALACGLANAVIPREDVLATATAIAERISAHGPLALRYAKEAIVRGQDLSLDAALRYETDLTVILQTTADRAEGVAAFVQKRPPKFRGK